MARKPSAPQAGESPRAAERIDARITEVGGWRGKTLRHVRAIICGADPEIVEEWKWETPVWSRGGILCTGEVYRKAVKLTFAKGASLDDPQGLFNASLEGKVRRAIDLHEGDAIDAEALGNLIRAAVAHNLAASPKAREKGAATGKGKGKAPAAPAAPAGSKAQSGPVLLSGGNPQIAKGEGNGPVQAYIAAMPGWKSEVGRRLDGLIERTVPGVQKAVKWNSPFYGVKGNGWFLAFHCFAKYVKVTFFRGTSLSPVPPGASKTKETRYLDIRENDTFDEALIGSWIAQASTRPGETL